MFVKNIKGGVTVLIISVDDIENGNDEAEVNNLKTYLGKEFEIRDLESKDILGIEVDGSKKVIVISLQKNMICLKK